MNISSYRQSEKTEIKQLFDDVFSQSEGPSEGILISNLVVDLMSSTKAEDIFGFVAKEKEQIIGCIFFTRLSFDLPVNAFILAPVAILTNYQGKGIGQKLIAYGIGELKKKRVELVFTYGDPDFYSKVGFRCITEDIVKAPLTLSQPEGWLCQSLTGDEIVPISARPRCVEALNRPKYW